MRASTRSILAAASVLAAASAAWAQTLVLDEPLSGASGGTRNGGQFLGDGWKVTGHTDFIYWHIPTLTAGAVEWDMRGLNASEGRAGMQDKAELFHMYDYTFGNADVNYNGGYRDDPYKHFVRKIGTQGGTTDALELVWQILPNFVEPDSPVLTWNPATTYTFRQEWGPDGAGNAVLRTYRDDALLRTTTVPGTWNPAGHSIRIAASPRAFIAPDGGAPVDAVYSNLKVWDLALSPPPPPPPPPPLPPPRTGEVSVNGHALSDDGGEFVGLGATYMQALRRTKFDRTRYRSDLDFLARRGVNFIRTLSMVGWYPAWQGKEIAPVTFQNQNGQTVNAWSDYWQQFTDMIDIAYDEFGLRTQVTIFADAQLMPNKADRIAHMNGVLDAIEGREHKVILLEVANEAWQNGFPGSQGIADLREFGQHLGSATDVLIALSATPEQTNASLEQMYAGSAADIATEHFSRDIGTVEGGWLPVRDPYRVNSAVGVPPVSSNEPIGPGASVSSEHDPIKLVSAAAYAWMSGLPMYVYHTSAGVFGDTAFEDMPGADNYRHVTEILPGDIANWQRSEGADPFTPFITFADGQPNLPWTAVPGATSGVLRHLSNVRGNEFYTLPIAILSGGVELEPRQDMTIQVFNPLTGEVAHEMTPAAGQRFTLPQGPQAYIIRGSYADGGPARIDLDRVDNPHGLLHKNAGDGQTVPATIGGRDARRNDNPASDFYMYFAAADWFTHQGEHPELFVTIEYFDDAGAPLSLQYDSNTGGTIEAFYKAGGSVARGDTQTWKKRVFHLTDAYFGNRQNNGADFRIFGGVGSTFYLDSAAVSLSRPTAEWNVSGGGAWSVDSNWLGGTPDSVNIGALFGAAIDGTTIVTVDGPRTVGVVTFDNANSYQLAGGGTVALEVTSGSAAVQVIQGNHAIAAPLALASDTSVNIAGGATLALSNLLDSSVQIAKSGGGRLDVNRVRAAGLSISAGSVKVLPGGGSAGVSQAGSLSIAAGATLDLTDNSLIVTGGDAGSWNGSGYTGIAGLVASGRVTSSDSDFGDLTALAVGEAEGDALVLYTYGGDATLDGKINIDDYGRIDGNVGQSGSVFGYFNGDFNYDGKINIDDYGIIDGNISRQGTPFMTGAMMASPAAVPEPATLALMHLAAALLHRRRRAGRKEQSK